MNTGLAEPTKNLTGVDYYRLGMSVLMTLLGGVIVFRTLSSGIFLLPLLVGGGFAFLGVYRLSFYYRYFRKRKA